MEYAETFEKMGRKKRRNASARADRSYVKTLRQQESIDRRIEGRKERRFISPELKKKVYLKYGHRCYLCGKPGADSLDHVIPLIKGGETTIENLRPTHAKCNEDKGAKIMILPIELEEKGW